MTLTKFIAKALWLRPNKTVTKLVDLYIDQHHQQIQRNHKVNLLEVAKLAFELGKISGNKKGKINDQNTEK